jgi:hypothetical protein
MYSLSRSSGKHHFYNADWESLPDYVIQAGLINSSKRHINKQVPAGSRAKDRKEEKMKVNTEVHGRGTFT